MKPMIGIDLGTTNMVIAYLKDTIPKILPNHLNQSTTPSIVSYTPSIVVGHAAKTQQDRITSIKRLIGRKYSALDYIPFTYAHTNGDIWIKRAGRGFSPVQVSADILKYVKKCADAFFKTNVEDAVITVPAYFDDTQRQATKDAGTIAGLKVMRVINEPTAAALAYGLDKNVDAKIAVYDFGGGTFDISILEIKDGIFEVLATNGNVSLGGDDIDNEICKYVKEKFERENNVILDHYSLLRLKDAVEELKKELSIKNEANISIPNILEDKKIDLNYTFTKKEIEDLVENIVKKTINPCKKALTDAKVDIKDIKHVILVGGATRMPLVRKIVKEIFNKEPDTTVDPDEAVAKGAAIQAGIIKGVMNDIILLDVTSLSLGIETVGGVFSKIIKRNTTIPTKQTQIFTTSEDNQTDVEIKIYQGERPLVKHNKYLGEIKIKNIVPMAKGQPRIEVTFESDANGIYKVTARDLNTNKEQTLEIKSISGLSDVEIQKIIEDAKNNEKKDQQQIKCNEIREEIKKIIKFNKNEELENLIHNEYFDYEEARKKLAEHILKQE